MLEELFYTTSLQSKWCWVIVLRLLHILCLFPLLEDSEFWVPDVYSPRVLVIIDSMVDSIVVVSFWLSSNPCAWFQFSLGLVFLLSFYCHYVQLAFCALCPSPHKRKFILQFPCSQHPLYFFSALFLHLFRFFRVVLLLAPLERVSLLFLLLFLLGVVLIVSFSCSSHKVNQHHELRFGIHGCVFLILLVLWQNLTTMVNARH